MPKLKLKREYRIEKVLEEGFKEILHEVALCLRELRKGGEKRMFRIIEIIIGLLLIFDAIKGLRGY